MIECDGLRGQAYFEESRRVGPVVGDDRGRSNGFALLQISRWAVAEASAGGATAAPRRAVLIGSTALFVGGLACPIKDQQSFGNLDSLFNCEGAPQD